MALSAIATALVELDVFRGICVPLRAMCLIPVTVTSVSPAQVHGVRYRFQVIRADTGRVPAQMIEFQAIRDTPHQKKPGRPVRLMDSSANPESSVPVVVFGSRPVKAASCVGQRHLFPESVQVGITGSGYFGCHSSHSTGARG